MNTESIILSHSARGMDVLSRYLPPDFLTRCAKNILGLPRGNVLIATGFYVKGRAETDGPPGAYALSYALAELGFTPVILTDRFCEGFFVAAGIKTVIAGNNLSPADILSALSPVALISTERCGKDADGRYKNMRGADISEYTPPIDDVFSLAYKNGIYTAGIGDGGNEIGMGNLAGVISNNLDISPCVVPVCDLIVAAVSNWGCYGLCAELGRIAGIRLLPSYDDIFSFLKHIVSLGAVDGVTGANTATVDGFSPEMSREIITRLEQQ